MLNFFKRNKKGSPDSEALKDLLLALNPTHRSLDNPNLLSGNPAYEELKKLPPDEQKGLILQLIRAMTAFAHRQEQLTGAAKYQSGELSYYGKYTALTVMAGLMRRKLQYSEAEWMELFRAYRNAVDAIAGLEGHYFHFNSFPVNASIKQIEYTLKKEPPGPELTAFIKEVLSWEGFEPSSGRTYYGSDMNKAHKKLKALLAEEDEVEAFRLGESDIGPSINEIIQDLPAPHDDHYRLFHLLASVAGGKPTKKFKDTLAELQEKIGPDKCRILAHQMFAVAVAHQPYEETTVYDHQGRQHEYTATYYLAAEHQQFLKGMAWSMERFSDKETLRQLTQLTEKAYQKIPGQGPAAAALGNACIYVLGNMRGKEGLGALSRLKLKVRQNNVKKSIDKYLLEGAKKYHVSVEELKEMAVPDFQLKDGQKTLDFDGYALSISIQASKVVQQWSKPDGSPMKSVPATVKNSSTLSKKLREARKEIKEIQKVYSAQKQRIDNQFILHRSWDYGAFRKYYLEHGLVSPISHQLIWTFTRDERSAEAIFLDGKWHNVAHEIIDWIDEKTQVQLWHPVFADETGILRWREKIMELEWKQPIKQAFREIYIVTDAEINTRTYSNRMAAHILKQHQFKSLAELRGWRYSLMGVYDDGREHEICEKHLPEFDLTAEYWIDELPQDDAFNDTGIWLYIGTDQVRFKNAEGSVIDIADVPKMVFTEIMRDVDMFVGVCSVGNDPQWMDNNGARQENRDYWTSFSFGDLTEIAKTRKTILARLLPRLKKIRDKASIDGKFLTVKGKLRTYNIHIGSGNILMEPNDQYLCIVPARSADKSTERLFIPFEGDKGLSIVLSKAFLLAEDDKISDPSIVSQIGRKAR